MYRGLELGTLSRTRGGELVKKWFARERERDYEVKDSGVVKAETSRL